MKNCFFLILLSCWLFIPHIQGQNVMVPRKYTCYYTAQPVKVDGKLDDKAWLDAPWSENFGDIVSGVSAPERQFTRFKMVWDSNYCYIAACLSESHLWGTLHRHDDTVYHDNDFEVFVDPDGDGLDYDELEINVLGTVMDLRMPKPYNQGGKADLSWDFKGLKSAVSVYGTVDHPADTDSRWTVELAIPWKSFTHGGLPKNGAVWRFNFSRVEWPLSVEKGTYTKQKNQQTGKVYPEKNWTWSPQGAVNMHIPQKWGYVRFVRRNPPAVVPEFWVWSVAHRDWNTQKWQSELEKLKNAGITGLLLKADTATLHKVALLAVCYGIQVHAWYITMNNPKAPAAWLSVNEQGKSLAEQKAYVDYYKFMCPGLPAVRQYLKQQMSKLMAVKGISGIHFDYIRYVDVILPKKLQPKYHLKQKDIMPPFDYGYHPYMRSMFRAKYGRDPLSLSDPLHDTAWLHFRLKVLDSTVIQLRNQIEKQGLKTSAAVFPTPSMSRRMVRQDWDSWHLNYYFPMAYHNYYGKKYAWLKKVSSVDKKAVGDSSKVFIGLFLPALKKSHQLTKAMKAAFKGGADGVAFFRLGVLDESMLKQIADFQKKRNRAGRKMKE